MVAYGASNYFHAARRSVASILERSDFDVHIAAGPQHSLRVPDTSRIRVQKLPASQLQERAHPFLLKFQALRDCLEKSPADWIVLMDADTLLVSHIDESDIPSALDGHSLGMVEQTGIRGSAMSRKDFLESYKKHTLAFFDPELSAPSLDEFRHFNSGVVLGHRKEFQRFVEWAQHVAGSMRGEHQVGTYMIADQDYFQLWTNNLNPGTCKQLPWMWNHCEHWDEGFPRKEAIIVHFSNFCNGPTRESLLRMSWLAFTR